LRENSLVLIKEFKKYQDGVNRELCPESEKLPYQKGSLTERDQDHIVMDNSVETLCKKLKLKKKRTKFIL